MDQILMYLFLSGSFLLSALLGLVVIPNILLISYKKRLFDQPDPRKVHSTPVPRLGGVSFFPVILITICLLTGLRYYAGFPLENLPAEHTLCVFLFLTVGCMMLYLVGVADDLIGVGYRYKFVIQILASLLLVLSGEWLNSLGGLFGIHTLSAIVGIPLSVLVIVYVTNAINLIDGIDGLASGLSCISLAALGLLHVLEGEVIYAMVAFATLGVLVPFWFYNVFGNANRGHKLFMGDAGSLMLGYILSFLAIHLSMLPAGGSGGDNPRLVVAFSTLLVPLFDVVRVVLHRLRKGRNPFLPDKNHFHHKLLRTGMPVRWVMVTILLVSVFFIVLNFCLVDCMNVTLLLLLDVVLWTAMQLFINYRIRLIEKRRPSC